MSGRIAITATASEKMPPINVPRKFLMAVSRSLMNQVNPVNRAKGTIGIMRYAYSAIFVPYKSEMTGFANRSIPAVAATPTAAIPKTVFLRSVIKDGMSLSLKLSEK